MDYWRMCKYRGRNSLGSFICSIRELTTSWRQCAEDPPVNNTLRFTGMLLLYAFKFSIIITVMACGENLDDPFLSSASWRDHC